MNLPEVSGNPSGAAWGHGSSVPIPPGTLIVLTASEYSWVENRGKEREV